MATSNINIMWNYLHCCGSIMGKHICLQASINGGGDYFNHKSFFRIVLLAIVDAKYCFTFLSVGFQGRLSHGGVFVKTTFKKLPDTSSSNLPPMKGFPGKLSCTPFCIIGRWGIPFTAAYYDTFSRDSRQSLTRTHL